MIADSISPDPQDALLPRIAPARVHRAIQVAMPATAGAAPGNDPHLSELVRMIAQTDESALARLYDATVDRVYGVAMRIVRTPELAEEVVSDVFLQVWRDARRYDEARGKVLAWLLIITRSRALDQLRRRDEAFSHPEPFNLSDEPMDDGHNPLDLLAATQANQQLNQAMEHLTPLQRQLLSLAFFRGYSHSEIVEHTGLPLGSVKTHIRRSLTILRDLLGPDFDSVRQEAS